MSHEILMLGTGNAFLPNGRHHSLALFDRKHLIDTPPTALISMRNHGISPADIETIFITHLHGDHIFGLPFILLERKYISDRENLRPLTIVAADGARERITQLCNAAYPNSLDSILEEIKWISSDNGITNDGWSWERFPVFHDDEVDPFGYRFVNDDASFVHSGDSGPCERLYQEIEKSQLAIIEMGIPEWVPNNQHHKPSDIDAVANKFSSVKFAVTHTYIDSKTYNGTPITEANFPTHPSNVYHAEDGDIFTWEGGWNW